MESTDQQIAAIERLVMHNITVIKQLAGDIRPPNSAVPKIIAQCINLELGLQQLNYERSTKNDSTV